VWFIYALGGGWGHLTRAAALARAAASRPVRILTNSPYAPVVREAAPELDIVALDPRMEIFDARPAVLAEIDRAQPSCLIVDTFPRGLVGELRGLARTNYPKALVHRALNFEYGERLAPFVRGAYQLVIVPGNGEGGIYDTGSVLTKPWIAGEPPVSAERHGVVVCVSGRGEEAEWYGRVAAMFADAGVDVRCLCAEPPTHCPPEICVRHWPGIEVLATARVVVGSGGYHTVHECAALGISLVGRAWPRKYDDQAARLQRTGAEIVENAEDAYCRANFSLCEASASLRGAKAPPELKLALQGTRQAVDLIEGLLAQHGTYNETKRPPHEQTIPGHRCRFGDCRRFLRAAGAGEAC
jgi:hypothetical protein